MTEDEALRIAQAFVNVVVLVPESKVPALYGFDPKEEYLFRVDCWRERRVGGSRYVAVSKTTGIARDAGSAGE